MAILFCNSSSISSDSVPKIFCKLININGKEINQKEGIVFLMYNTGGHSYIIDTGIMPFPQKSRPYVAVYFRFFDESGIEYPMRDIGLIYLPFKQGEERDFSRGNMMGFYTDLISGKWRFDGPPGKYTVLAEMKFGVRSYFEKFPKEKEIILKKYDIKKEEEPYIFPEGIISSNKIQINWGGKEKGIIPAK